MSRPFAPCPAGRALAALHRALAPHLGPHRLIASTSSDWASATFEGARHRLAIVLEGEDAADRAAVIQATLAEADLPLAGAFVADIQVIARRTGATPVLGIAALTIVEVAPQEAAGAISRAVRQAG